MAKCNKCGKPSSLGHRCDPYDRRRYSGTSNSITPSDTYVFPDVAVGISVDTDDSFRGGGGSFGGGGSSGDWGSSSSDSGSSDSGSSSSSD